MLVGRRRGEPGSDKTKRSADDLRHYRLVKSADHGSPPTSGRAEMHLASALPRYHCARTMYVWDGTRTCRRATSPSNQRSACSSGCSSAMLTPPPAFDELTTASHSAAQHPFSTSWRHTASVVAVGPSPMVEARTRGARTSTQRYEPQRAGKKSRT